jgi:hypothetical protein
MKVICKKIDNIWYVYDYTSIECQNHYLENNVKFTGSLLLIWSFIIPITIFIILRRK